jgi:hypothetical protein
MTIRNGDLANETNFNNAFMSRIIKALGVGIEISSTTEFSRPYPIMAEAERDLIVAAEGDCLYNSDTKKLEVYDGTVWGTYDNVDSVNGKTGVVVLDKTDIGLGNVDNTSDANKPISTATQTALDLKADVTALTAHIDTNPAHTEIDTKVNLDTWALTATNGADAFASDEKKKYHVVDAALVEGGGAGGGAEVPSTYKLFNAEDGDITGFTNITINTTTPINGEADYEVTAYPAAFSDVSTVPRNLGKKNTLTIQYTIVSGTAKISIGGGGMADPVEAEIDNTSKEVVLEYYPLTNAVLTLDITDVSSATTFRLDDLEFSDAAARVKEFTRTNSIGLEGNAGEVMLVSKVPFAGTGTGWDSANRQYTMQYSDSVMFLKGSITYTGAVATPFTNIQKNGVYHKTINNSPTGTTGSVKDFTYTSKVGEFALGDIISFTSRDGTLQNVPEQHFLNIVETSTSSGTVFARDNNDLTDILVEAKNGGAGAVAINTPISFTEVSDASGIYDGTTVVPTKNGQYKFEGVIATSIAENLAIYLFEDGVNISTIGFDNIANGFTNFNRTVTLTKDKSYTIRPSGSITIVSDNFHVLTVTKQASDVDNVIIENAGTSMVTGGVEYQTVDTLDGAPVYARTWDIVQNVAAGTQVTIATTALSLDVLDLYGMVLSGTNWYKMNTNIGGNNNYVTYHPPSGVIDIRHDGITSSQQRFTLRYTKP